MIKAKQPFAFISNDHFALFWARHHIFNWNMKTIKYYLSVSRSAASAILALDSATSHASSKSSGIIELNT